MIFQWLVAILLVVGSLFSLLAAIGILRMPDLYMRMQAATKSSTLGISCIVLAAAMHTNDAAISVQASLVVAFLVLTAPVLAHMVGWAAYSLGTPLWEGTVIDELQATDQSSERHNPLQNARALNDPEDPAF